MKSRLQIEGKHLKMLTILNGNLSKMYYPLPCLLKQIMLNIMHISFITQDHHLRAAIRIPYYHLVLWFSVLLSGFLLVLFCNCYVWLPNKPLPWVSGLLLPVFYGLSIRQCSLFDTMYQVLVIRRSLLNALLQHRRVKISGTFIFPLLIQDGVLNACICERTEV